MTNKSVQINRDPFARASLMRRKVEKPGECTYCCQPARFEYAWEGDGVRYGGGLGWSRPFCSVSCYRNYYL
jgi:hypothetical protein